MRNEFATIALHQALEMVKILADSGYDEIVISRDEDWWSVNWAKSIMEGECAMLLSYEEQDLVIKHRIDRENEAQRIKCGNCRMVDDGR